MTAPANDAELKEWRPLGAPRMEARSGAYCALEPLNPARHGEELWRALSGPDRAELWRYKLEGPFGRLQSFMFWLTAAAASGEPYYYVFRPLEGPGAGAAQGVAAFGRVAPAHGSIEIGYIAFSPELQRTRAATEGLSMMMGQALGAGWRRCEWKCDAANAASRKAALRLGFSYEGLHRQAMVIKGRNRDTAWYSAIDSEWPALETAHKRWLAAENFDAEGRQLTSLSALTAPLLKATGEEK